jgi:predicted RNase H-like nuclease (RuvC/YqgF family)
MDFNELSESLRPVYNDIMGEEYKDARIEALERKVKELEDKLSESKQEIGLAIYKLKEYLDNE